ncbi:MAG: deoxyribodipyrimidine photolyase, partial [Dehalococcoidia bacterium]|nr:deoxyribodipyrimidine photolyase [Dehalococcoidia bacterium]
MIHQERVRHLNHQGATKGAFVLYWMQASQRTSYNHALEYAIEQSNLRQLPLLVLIVVTDTYPEANLR